MVCSADAKAIDELDERCADVSATRDRVAFEDERGEEAIASGESLTDQCLGDRLGFVEVVDVLDDAEQIPRVGHVHVSLGGRW
jgi:hypothetical protein